MKFNSINVLIIILMFAGINIQANEFDWLRDDSRENDKVVNYLQQQNQQTEAWLKPTVPLQKELLAEWSNNRPQRGEQPWLLIGNAEYNIENHNGRRSLLTRELTGQNIKVLVDISLRQEKSDYYELGAWTISSDLHYVALAEDYDGSEQYTITVVDLFTQKEVVIAEGYAANIIWGQDSKSLYLIGLEKNTQRPNTLHRFYVANSKPAEFLLEETSKDWLLSFYSSGNKDYALVQSNNESSSEQRLLSLKSGNLSVPIRPRKTDVEYYADVDEETLYLNSNLDGVFKLYRSSLSEPSKWSIFYQPKLGAQINNFYLFSAGPVVITQADQIKKINVLSKSGRVRFSTELGTKGSVEWLSRSGDYNSNQLHIRTMSMITPPKWDRLNTRTLQRTLLSQDNYPTFDSALYYTEQVYIQSGTEKIPVTLAYRKDKFNSESAIFLYGYGAYGMTMKPYFMPQITSLMDRGIVYAIAHVRGGYKGEEWHHAGAGINKAVSISDFTQVAESMKGYKNGLHPIFAIGGSAGGTLVSASLNKCPDLFSGAVLQVPFVDVVASMSDTSLPLTAQQYDEWGNPHLTSQLLIMRAYDPIRNLKIQDYPPVLTRVGLQDRRVPYWEGAKYIAKLSQMSQSSGPYLLYTDFKAGHASDRRQSLANQAREYSFLLTLDKLTKAEP
ncbi:prolyl oligopeptidase family serine peptidase [Moritella viscosa]|uniref:Protease II n=1 Tax=Moritella viscosa TaxID=80854 RepID=A0A1L0CAP1_9GAMM|nr:prolyl oligopeptidase family serine peptidase [Moritella viscosa]SGZ17926.1 Protease II [Moritella viscosa]SHN98744.1 Protease II [Moritella viscosa]SHN98748.1 Protease II [Moritella viscosa]SHO00688.1 Protease II [Moritella viscosa]